MRSIYNIGNIRKSKNPRPALCGVKSPKIMALVSLFCKAVQRPEVTSQPQRIGVQESHYQACIDSIALYQRGLDRKAYYFKKEYCAKF